MRLMNEKIAKAVDAALLCPMSRTRHVSQARGGSATVQRLGYLRLFRVLALPRLHCVLPTGARLHPSSE